MGSPPPSPPPRMSSMAGPQGAGRGSRLLQQLFSKLPVLLVGLSGLLTSLLLGLTLVSSLPFHNTILLTLGVVRQVSECSTNAHMCSTLALLALLLLATGFCAFASTSSLLLVGVVCDKASMLVPWMVTITATLLLLVLHIVANYIFNFGGFNYNYFIAVSEGLIILGLGQLFLVKQFKAKLEKGKVVEQFFKA